MVTTTSIKSNARDLQSELQWFREVLKTRSLLNANAECKYTDVFEVPLPTLSSEDSGYHRLVREYQFSFEERFILMLALVPHVRPELLDMFLARNEQTQQVYTEFGGKRGKFHNG
ncbi:MAG: hypothetical protein KDD36_05575, partial [Flavobacteriales bacterium]|nr:hypothetical protein [Flavobacteriales bacterium]